MENTEQSQAIEAPVVETQPAVVEAPAAAAPPVVVAPSAPPPVNAPPSLRGEPVNKQTLIQLQQENAIVAPQTLIYPERADGAVPVNIQNFTKIPAPGQPNPAPVQPNEPAAPPAQATQPAALEAPIETQQPSAQPAAQPMADNAWEQLTGGQIKTQADWETFQSERQRLSEEVNRLSTTRVEPANALVAKINDVFKQGGDMAAVASLIQAQNLDPASMKPLEQIKASIGFQHPDLDHEEIEAYVQRLGIDLQDPEGPSTKVAIKIEAKKAADYLNGLKVQMDNPAVLQNAQNMAADAARNQEAWKSAPPVPRRITVNEKIGEVAITTDFDFSPEALSYAEQVAGGMKALPATPQTFNDYQHFSTVLAQAYDIERYTKHIIEETQKAATLATMKKVAGPTPQPVPHATPPEPAKKYVHVPMSGR